MMKKIQVKIISAVLFAAASLFAGESRIIGEVYEVGQTQLCFTASQGALTVECSPETVLAKTIEIPKDEAIADGARVELTGFPDKRYDRDGVACFSASEWTRLPEDSTLPVDTESKYLVRGRIEMKGDVAFLHVNEKTFYAMPAWNVRYLKPVKILMSDIHLHDTVTVIGELSGDTVKAQRVTITPNAYEMPETPGLPRVLLIGDSVSIGYTPFVREDLEGKVNIQRISMNGGPTPRMFTYYKEWLGAYWKDGFKWDLIHFNFGLHDLRITGGKNYTDLETYEENLRKIIAILKETGAKLVWASTTPVPEGANPGSTWGSPVNSDVIKYNKAAAAIMKENGIAIDDLYGTIYPEFEKYLHDPTNIHYNDEGSKILADHISKVILKELKNK